MVNKYFNVTVKPTIKASEQAANSGVYSTGDVIFDWHAIDVPKGASKLIGVTAILRQKHGTVTNEFPFQLVYAKSINGVAPTSLGTVNETADGVGYYSNLIGKSSFIAKDFSTDHFDNGASIAALTQGGADSEKPSIVLEGEPDSGTNVGYDKLYVAMLGEGNFDFSTAVAIGPGAGVDISGNNGTFGVIDGTDPTLCFAPGDVLHAQDDIIVGEVASLDASNITFKFSGEATASETDYTVPSTLANWVIQNGAGAAGDLLENDELFNINPIKIILHFEK
ncbi:hypothetical protein N9C94_00685 [Candidatus Pelagibacter sp.]|nr:hypothetical protein [Candidatus Pelagibacter sp.]